MGWSVLGLVNGPWYTWQVVDVVAGFTLGVGAIMLAGSLVGLAFTEESDRRRKLYLRLLAGLVSLAAILATLYTVLLLLVGCGMSPSTYNGWGCRGSKVYWPDALSAIFATWIVAIGLVWPALRQSSTGGA